MSVERKIVIGDERQEQVAVFTVAIPAGAEMEIERTWRFEGWLLKRRLYWGGVRLKVEEPQRINIEEPE